jgi:hypothetical protein
VSHPVPPAEQPSPGGYTPQTEYPSGQPAYSPAPSQPIYPPAPGYPAQQYPPQYATPPVSGYPQGQPYPHQPYPPQYAPQVIIQNNTSAVAFGGGYRLRKRQSIGVHILLFLFTAGLGNVLYAWYVIDWNRRHGF